MIGKQPLIIGNWKMTLSLTESVRLARTLLEAIEPPRQTEIVIAPSFEALVSVGEIIRDSALKLAAQDVAPFGPGAHTGFVAAAHLAPLGVAYAILGHSERRLEAYETDGMIADKVAACVAAHIIPVLCIGETRAERRSGRTRTVLRRQLQKGLEKIPKNAPLVIAYEPVWAIGAKKPATPKLITEAHENIRALLDRSARVVYGGSVDAASATFFAAEPLIDGLLVGRASLDESQFRGIIQAYESR